MTDRIWATPDGYAELLGLQEVAEYGRPKNTPIYHAAAAEAVPQLIAEIRRLTKVVGDQDARNALALSEAADLRRANRELRQEIDVIEFAERI